MAEHNEIGKIGESLAKTFLMKQGFTIVEQNYRILQGEIDIVAKKDKVYCHFPTIILKIQRFADVTLKKTYLKNFDHFLLHFRLKKKSIQALKQTVPDVFDGCPSFYF